MLEPDDRAELLGLGRPVHYRRGAWIIIQGDHSDEVFLLVEGRVKVTLDTATGREVVLAVDGRGDLLGTFEAIDAQIRARTASTVALEPVACRVLTGEQFRDYLAAHPAASRVLAAWVIRRLQAADRRRIDGTTLDTPHRLAQFLLDLVERDGRGDQGGVDIDIPLPQHELASLIGVSRNSVVRALAALRSRGLVATSRHTITIADLAALRRYAE
jgi:CRP/FNR family transcriptional regulator, cyclic AMP receptor protein